MSAPKPASPNERTVYDPAVGAERALTPREADEVAREEARQDLYPDLDFGDPLDGLELELEKAFDEREVGS